MHKANSEKTLSKEIAGFERKFDSWKSLRDPGGQHSKSQGQAAANPKRAGARNVIPEVIVRAERSSSACQGSAFPVGYFFPACLQLAVWLFVDGGLAGACRGTECVRPCLSMRVTLAVVYGVCCMASHHLSPAETPSRCGALWPFGLLLCGGF